MYHDSTVRGDGINIMSLQEKVEIIRRFFGAAFVTLDVLSDVAAMNVAMGIDGEGSLPAQVKKLGTSPRPWALFS